MIGDMGDKIKDILVGVIMALLVGVGIIFPIPIPFAMHFVVLFSILYHGQLLGQALFTKARAISSVLAGSWIFLGILALIQTACFYLNLPLNAVSDAWSLIGSIVLAQLIHLIVNERQGEETPVQNGTVWQKYGFPLILIGTSLALALSILIPAWRAGTTASIRTPWPLLPKGTLVAIACLWGIQLLARFWQQRNEVIAFIDGIGLFSITALTPLIYRIGFGFDGFLHIASEKILLATGTLQPKPFYYIGQYVFTTWFSRMTDVSIANIDRWLVPVMAACCVPLCISLISRSQSAFRFFPLALLPLGLFIATTPQAFAFLIGFCALLFAMGTKNAEIHWLAPLILALWSSAIHPLAGIPFLFGCFALYVSHLEASTLLAKSMRFFGMSFGVFLASCSVPILFYILSMKQGNSDQWHFSALATTQPWQDLVQHLIPSLANHFVIWPAWSSLITTITPLVLFISGCVSWVYVRRQETQTESMSARTVACLLLIGLGLFVSYAVLKSSGDFAFLIDYERGNYADRVFVLGTLFCFIASLPWMTHVLRSLKHLPPFLFVAGCVAYASIASGTAYSALPRHDALITGRGWSTSQADIEAVRFIDRQAGNAPYGVLANQSVSAAAVSQLGFKRYAKNDVFFYPIPTGGPLYDQFLRLTYRDPNLDPIKDAAQLTQAQNIFVVINDYWWNASKLNENLRAITQDHWTFGNVDGGLGSRVDVYHFSRNISSN